MFNTANPHFTRRLHVETKGPARGQTRTLSEMIFRNPRSPRITPRSRFDMDIEIPRSFAGTVDLFSRTLDEETESRMMEREDTGEPDAETEPRQEEKRDVSSVVDVIFEIHSALKTRHMGQRTAASALAASKLVSTIPVASPLPRDAQLELLENARRMMECSVCQDIFTNATEATCCGQIYCQDCIERWVMANSSCPMCREKLSLDQLTVSRHAQRMANEMMTACAYCMDSMKKGELKAHLLECDQAPSEPELPHEMLIRRNRFQRAKQNLSVYRDFLRAPSPPEIGMTQCYISARSGTYQLFALEGDLLLCTAARRRQMDMSFRYDLSVPTEKLQVASEGSALVARLERNFTGSQYTIYGMDQQEAGSKEDMGAVQYAATYGKSPRQMRVAVPCVESKEPSPELMVREWQHQASANSMLSQIESPDTEQCINFINKPPVWIEHLEAYCLDFGGRVQAASVKNFLLSKPDDMDSTMMLFGRTEDRSVFSMDFRHPLSPLQAFAIALSSMDSHLITFD